ncbi:uncharacterized protein LOC105393543 [Plutella xylostella]|uniref:uncharacterized protein LOC105393543 n=1 Tax=Plutella xylostella TaxID=51655 RepID=UPI002032D449|nr:uncharacterized protein LOC105393543 [Plutella xylostella]
MSTTDEEKSRINKLLSELEVPEVKLSARCSDLVKEFQTKFQAEVEDEETMKEEVFENPYKVDAELMGENERKLSELLAESKRAKRATSKSAPSSEDAARPWRTHSSRERLLRVDLELRRHHEKASQLITALPDEEMKDLVKQCEAEPNLTKPMTIRAVVDEAKKNLPNFQFRKIENSTATGIYADAHKAATEDRTEIVNEAT